MGRARPIVRHLDGGILAAQGSSLPISAFVAWADHVGVTESDQLDRFEELYRGQWDSAEDYAQQLLDDMGATEAIEKLPEWLQCYVELDVAGFARDLDIGGDITVVAKPEGGVWIWSST